MRVTKDQSEKPTLENPRPLPKRGAGHEKHNIKKNRFRLKRVGKIKLIRKPGASIEHNICARFELKLVFASGKKCPIIDIPLICNGAVPLDSAPFCVVYS